ncbi:MAG: 2-oxo acid dehydrogenase subunit E2, partial [Candidatus Eremiobacteraeota bacterium]|nr:2-oxo acid dehydrogenase subunit E2 [Candidatus Eremiobacteraeota bacterium]
MAVELEMPELAESVIEGEIVKWLVAEGEQVAQDQPLVEVMTDKVTVEIPSPYEGVLLKQVAPEGAVVAIGKPIAIFGKAGETVQAGAQPEHVTPQPKVVEDKAAPQPPQPAQPAQAAPQDPAQAVKPAPAAASSSNGQPASPAVGPREKATLSAFGRPMATPAVRKLARESNVDLFSVAGSGEGGRITRADVERVAAARPAAGQSKAPAPATPQPSPDRTERVPLRGLRRAIADRMVQSKHTAAHTLHVDEADLTELVAMRARVKDLAAERGVKLTYLPFFVKAVCAALKKYPYVNASLDDEAHEIVLKKDYNIGIAANTDAGLVVPVIAAADRLSIFELARSIADVAERARANKLSHADISGGTFTITNVGSVGGLFTFPVINYPEVAILGTHSVAPRPVVRGGEIVIRQMMYLSIS